MHKSILLKLHLRPSPLWTIFEVNFFRNLASAVLTAILPIYFKKFVGSDALVGVIFLIGYIAAMISSYYSSHIIEHFKKRKALVLALIAFTMLFALFAIANHTAIVLMIFALYQFILSLFILDISLYIKHYSNFRTIAENSGKAGAFGNIGWMVGPLLGALIADKFGFEAVFLLSSLISLIALAMFFFVRLANEETHFSHTRHFLENVKQFFKDANLRKTYINNSGLWFIYSIWDFLPLLMLTINGVTLPIIGMTKTLMGIPQAIFEFPIGRMADRETGERKIFIIGYALAAIFTIFLGFTTNLHAFITFFFIAAVGTSFLEMTRDSYFFRQMPEREVELISVYRTGDTLPYVIGQGLAILTLIFVPLKIWFIIGGIVGIWFIINAYGLKDLRK